jgi:hypothetical protein
MGQSPSVDALTRAVERAQASLPQERGISPTLGPSTDTSRATERECSKIKRIDPVVGVKAFFDGLNDTDKFEYCLGFDKPGAPPLAESVTLIALECGTVLGEEHVMDIGLHVIEREDMRRHLPLPGPHSANLFKSVAYHHLRMQQNAHYVNQLPDPNHGESNHFGATRFMDEEEVAAFLEACFVRRIKKEPEETIDDPIRDGYVMPQSEEGEFRPVVLVNFHLDQLHKLRLLQKTFDCRPDIWNNVVGTISTQDIATQQGFDWRDTKITLSQLCCGFGFSHLDSGSAADYAAYTLICAVQMVMRRRIPLARESIRSVVNTTMLYSQSIVPAWGKKNFCTRCAKDTHRRPACDWMHVAVVCSNCGRNGRRNLMYTHTLKVCGW